MKKSIIILLALSGLFCTSWSNSPFTVAEKSIVCSLPDTLGQGKITKTNGYEAKTTDISFARIETYMDSTYYPKSLYYNIRFAEVLGVPANAANTGKMTVKLLNEKQEEIPLVKDPKFYAAKTFKEGEQINILMSIPLNATNVNNKKYTYSLSFETSTGKQIISMSGKIGYK
jgi:hypothetical protein